MVIERSIFNMSSVSERQRELVAEFSRFGDWEARYKYVISLGKELPPLSQEYYDEKYKVRGCQSQVWMHARLDEQGGMEIVADSDAMIVKGLVALLVRVYSGAKPDEILASTPEFLKEIGLEQHLSPSRANGFYAMVKQIYLYATAFKALA